MFEIAFVSITLQRYCFRSKSSKTWHDFNRSGLQLFDASNKPGYYLQHWSYFMIDAFFLKRGTQTLDNDCNSKHVKKLHHVNTFQRHFHLYSKQTSAGDASLKFVSSQSVTWLTNSIRDIAMFITMVHTRKGKRSMSRRHFLLMQVVARSNCRRKIRIYSIRAVSCPLQ